MAYFSMDGAVVARQTWAQSEAKKRMVQAFSIAVPDGQHTLAVRATDWAGKVQEPHTQIYTGNTQGPAVTLDGTASADGILRMQCTVNDAVGINGVRIRLGTHGWAQATISDGRWRVAYPTIGVDASTVTVQATNTVGMQTIVT